MDDFLTSPLGIFLSVIVLLGAAWKASPGAWRFVKAVAHVPDMAENVVKVAAAADRILNEFAPNGGGLREAVNRLDAALAEIVAWQLSHLGESIAQNLAVQSKLASTLDLIIERTSVTREGSSEPEPLSTYTQESIHRVLNSITANLGYIPLIQTRLERLEATLAAEHSSVEASQAETRARLSEVHAELRTMNDLTVGEMADADESRRITAIPEADRTDAENRHLDDLEPTKEENP